MLSVVEGGVDPLRLRDYEGLCLGARVQQRDGSPPEGAVPLRTPPRQLALTAAARTLGPRGGAHWLTLRDGRRNAAAHAGRT